MLTIKPNLHWRYTLMIVHSVIVMLRDDAPVPLVVWDTVLSKMVTDLSHVRKVCIRALGKALSLLQTRRRSKEPRDPSEAPFQEKNFGLWNGPLPSRPPRDTGEKSEHFTAEYEAEVLSLLGARLKDGAWLSKLVTYMSVVQSGRPKDFVGSQAQMFKALFKMLGVEALAAFEPFLKGLSEDASAHARLSSDVFMGQQCLASELVGGLVRGMKYWEPENKERGQKIVLLVLSRVLNAPEMESVGVWSAALRFAIFDRHPASVKWLLTFVFDLASPPPGGGGVGGVIVVVKRLLMTRPLLNELSWRCAPLQRQLLHDLTSMLAHPSAQARDCVASCLATVSRVSWSPPFPDVASIGDEMQDAAMSGVRAQPETAIFRKGELVRPTSTMHRLVSSVAEEASSLSEKVAKAQAEASPGGEEGKEVAESLKADEEELKNRRQVLVLWLISVCPVYEHMYQSPLAAHLACLLPQLLQTIADKDKTLAKQAKSCAEYVANTPMLAPAILPHVLSTAQAMIASQSWHVRAAVLPFLQTVMFRHQFVVKSADMDKVRATPHTHNHPIPIPGHLR